MSDDKAAASNATEDHVSDDEKLDDEQTNPNQKKEDAKVEKELDRVTDRVDDEEIGAENIGHVKLLALFSLKKSTVSVFVQALSTINDKRHLDESKRQAKQAALANVKIRNEDVDFIVQEFEFVRSKAEKVLRQHSGDLQATLKSLVNA